MAAKQLEDDIMEQDIEAIIKRALEAAKTEELRDMAGAVKALAEYMKDGFQKITETLRDHSRLLENHSKVLERLVEEVGGLKIMIGTFTSRTGIQVEHMVLSLLRKTLLELKGIDVDKVEKKSFRDEKGELLHPTQKVEIDIYMADRQTYAIEVKSLLEEEDVDWIIAKRKFLEKTHSLEAAWLIVASTITEEAYRKALQNKIDVTYGTLIPTAA